MPTLIPVVPAKDRRHLHHGDKGNDVKAYGRLVHRTLTHLGLKAVNAQNGVFGDGLLIDTLALQRHQKLKATGIVNLATWQAVDPQMHAYERLLLILKVKPKPVAPRGQRVAASMRAKLVLRMPYYSQRRPAARTTVDWDRIGSDCSGSVLLSEAEVDGYAYDGYGNTGSIWAEFDPVAEKDVILGDELVYGSNGVTRHVAIVSEVKNKLAIGFGSAPGREAGWRSYRTDVMGFRRRRA